MSELKSIHAFDVYKVYTKTGDDDAAQVYLRPEADTAIKKLNRACKSCIDKYCQFPVQRISFKEALARHFKAVKDTTCNCLFCRNLNKQSTAQ